MGSTLEDSGANLPLAMRRKLERSRRCARNLGAIVSAAAILAACESFTEILGPTFFASTPTGAQVQPVAVTTSATSSFTGALQPTGREFSYTLTWETLSGEATAVHFHGPADATEVGPVLVDFSALPSGSTGTIELSATGLVTGTLNLALPMTPTVSGDSLRVLLKQGLVYVDVHTVANPDGEIRGQVRAQ